MEFQKIQLTTVSRHRNGIEPIKIAAIKGNNLILERFNGRTQQFPVSYPAGYEIGQYLDVVFFNTGNSSHGMRYIGITPPQFCPDAEAR